MQRRAVAPAIPAPSAPLQPAAQEQDAVREVVESFLDAEDLTALVSAKLLSF